MKKTRSSAGDSSDGIARIPTLLKLEQWPAADRDAFERARRLGSGFNKPGPAAAWRPATCELAIKSYGRFLSFLARHNWLLASEGPRQRVTYERLTEYLAEAESSLSPLSIRLGLGQLRTMMNMLAPGVDWGWITRHPRRPNAAEIRAGMKAKRTFDPAYMLHRAMTEMDCLKHQTLSTQSCLRYRDALIVAFECLFEVRRRNLWEMALGTHLIISDSLIRLRFPQTKTHLEEEFAVSPAFSPYIRSYVDNHRPVLLGQMASDSVWIDKFGKAVPYEMFHEIFSRIGKAWLGFHISCHDFRYSAATHILTRDPRNAVLASGVLAHQWPQSVNQFYDQSGDKGARRVWDALRRKAMKAPFS